jgi:hypothetical protein
MEDPDRRRRSRCGRVRDALIWGAALGAASGAVLGDAIDGIGAGPGAVIGAALYAPAETITSLRRGPAEPKPLWYRILSSALLMALFGWLLGLIYGPDEPLLTALISGALIGSLGLRPAKAALGLLIGAVLGALFQALDSDLEPALIAAAVTLTYRVIAAIAYRGRQLVRVMAEEVPASELRYVVPFEARSKYVGADYVAQLAKLRGGTFRRNPPDVGILASLRQPGRADLQRRLGAPADPRVLRAHQPLRALHRPRVAALDEARIRGLQAVGCATARPGRDPLQHRRGAARHGEHDRHDRPAGQP